MNLNKGISIPIAISIILVTAALAGSVLYWQYQKIQETETSRPVIHKESSQKGENKDFNYPEDYILQKNELPFDFKYSQSLKGTEMDQYLDSNPGYVEFDYQPGEGPKETYCGVLFSEEKVSPIVICAFKMHSKEDLEKAEKDTDAMEVFQNKTLLLKNNEKVLVSIVADESVSGSSSSYEGMAFWVDTVDKLGSILEQRSDLKRISFDSEKRKKEAEEYMEKALNHLEEANRISDSDNLSGEERKARVQHETRRAISLSKRAVELDPKNPELWFKRGNIYFELRDIEGAEEIIIRCYKKALKLDPGNSKYQEKLDQVQ